MGLPIPSRDNASFWILGLVNNFTFCVFITAAEEIIKGYAGLILFCTVVPGFVTRLAFSLYVERIPYAFRITVVSLSSAFFILVVALSSSVPVQLLSLALQAAIGALGEISFLALTSRFSKSVVGAWSSGTGASGIAGAGTYVLLRNVFGLSSAQTLIACSWIPLILIVIYQGVLVNSQSFERVPSGGKHEGGHTAAEEEGRPSITERVFFPTLFWKFMLPLAVVYFAEYTINQGVLGTLTEFKNDKQYEVETIYTQLQFTYQIAVFFARSSTYFFKVHAIWVLPILQMLNLGILALSSMFVLLPSATVAFAIVFWEGLLGGLTYVNSFYRIRTETPSHLVEWALGTATVGDAAGISLAAIVSIWLESAIKNFRK